MNFNLETLLAAKLKMPPLDYKDAVFNSKAWQRLRIDEKFKTVDNLFFGMRVYVKQGQKRACWIIGDAELVKKYLNGEVNEQYLERAQKWNEGIDGANMQITERAEEPETNK